jgi:copper transport protein
LAGLVTREAWTGWVTADGLLAALVTGGAGVSAAAVSDLSPTTRQRAIVLAAVTVALAAPALVGHTCSYGPPVLVMASDVAHVVTGATWFGGLLGLGVTLTSLARRERLAAETFARFSTVAVGLLAVVGAAGLVLGWRIFGSWAGLLGTTYGLILLAKLGIVALAVAVAGWNRYRLLPRVGQAAGYRDRTDAAGRLRTAVQAEAGLLVVALVLTGFLVNQVPREKRAPGSAERGTVASVADNVRVVAHLEPARVGTNTVTVQVQDLSGEPVEPYVQPTISISSDHLDLGSRPARNVDAGRYEAEVLIPHEGTWNVMVSVRTSEFENPVVMLETTVDGDD